MRTKKNTKTSDLIYQTTMTLLGHLSSERYNDSVPILIETPGLIDPNFEIDTGWRLIDSCIYSGALHAPEILASIGADLSLKNEEGLKPFEFALTRGFPRDSYSMDVLAGKKEPRPLHEIVNEFYDLVNKYNQSLSTPAKKPAELRL